MTPLLGDGHPGLKVEIEVVSAGVAAHQLRRHSDGRGEEDHGGAGQSLESV